MTEATQTATTNDAREASKSRVQTQETILAKLNPPESASKTTEGKPEGEQNKDGEESKPKKSPGERIQELIARRKEAEEKASEAERRASELEARVQALQTQAKPMEANPRPIRAQFATEDEYIESLSDWKAREAIAKREAEQAKAREEADQAEIASQWSKRQEAAMKTLPDYADVVGKSEVSMPDYLFMALMESEQGPQIAYYLGLHPDEAKRIAGMKPVAAIKRLSALERDLAEIDAQDEPKKAEETTPKVQKSKAPAPIETIKSVPNSSGTTSDYEEYRRRRQAEKRQ